MSKWVILSTYEWVKSRITNMRESCETYEWVMSHMLRCKRVMACMIRATRLFAFAPYYSHICHLLCVIHTFAPYYSHICPLSFTHLPPIIHTFAPYYVLFTHLPPTIHIFVPYHLHVCPLLFTHLSPIACDHHELVTWWMSQVHIWMSHVTHCRGQMCDWVVSRA